MAITNQAYINAMLLNIPRGDFYDNAAAFLRSEDPVAREAAAELVLGNPVNGRRYRFITGASRIEQCANAIFDRCISNPALVIPLNRGFEGRILLPSYPLWKRVCYVVVPEGVASVFANGYFQIIASFVFFYKLGSVYLKSYRWISHSWTTVVVPFIIGHTSLRIMNVFNVVMGKIYLARAWYAANKFKLLIYSFVAQAILVRVPIPFINGIARRFNPLNIYRSYTVGIYDHIIKEVLNNLFVVSNRCNEVKGLLNGIAQDARDEAILIERRNARVIWNQVMREQGILEPIRAANI